MEIIKTIIDFVLHIDVHLAELVAAYDLWVYGILFVIIFCETGLVVTPFLPGDSLLFVAGTLCARGDNDLHLLVLMGVVAAAAILGDSVNFEIGKFFGKKLFSNPNSKIFKQKYLQQTHDFYAKHGGKTIVLARFVPVVRTFAPFVAGMGRMNYKYFITHNFLGGIIWVALFCVAGYFVGNVGWVQDNLSMLIILIIVVSCFPAIFEIVRNKLKSKREAKAEITNAGQE